MRSIDRYGVRFTYAPYPSNPHEIRLGRRDWDSNPGTSRSAVFKTSRHQNLDVLRVADLWVGFWLAVNAVYEESRMRLHDAVDEYLLSNRYLSPNTMRWYRYKLSELLKWSNEHGVEDVEQLNEHYLRAFLRDVEAAPPSGRAVSSYTIKGFAQVIKGFATWVEAEGILPRNVGKRVELPHVDQTLIKTFSPEDIQKLFHACTMYRYPLRNTAIVAVLLDTGIRAQELCGLTLDRTHIHPSDSYLKVMGKGRKEREVPLGQRSRMALMRYLHRERSAPSRVDETFVGKGGLSISPNGLAKIIDRLNRAAGIEDVRVSPHTFRHTFAVNYLKNGGDVYRLSRILGHAGVQVTEIYLRDFNTKDAREGYKSVLDELR